MVAHATWSRLRFGCELSAEPVRMSTARPLCLRIPNRDSTAANRDCRHHDPRPGQQVEYPIDGSSHRVGSDQYPDEGDPGGQADADGSALPGMEALAQ